MVLRFAIRETFVRDSKRNLTRTTRLFRPVEIPDRKIPPVVNPRNQHVTRPIPRNEPDAPSDHTRAASVTDQIVGGKRIGIKAVKTIQYGGDQTHLRVFPFL